ncbi:MAG TPA: CPBP family intramembrane glutamic endopeptidase [Allosphingosinicella sp.]
MAVAVGIDGWARLLIRPGPTAAWVPAPALIAPVLVALLAAYFLLAFLPLVQSLRGLRWRRAYQAAIRRELERIPGMVPNNSPERAAWIALSLTAGICEEVLFRGFLIRFLHESALALPIAAALAASCLCFGLAHVYLGPKGALTAAIGGFGYGLLFLLSGNLLPCVVLHALVDLQIIYVMRPIPGEAATAAIETA